MPMTFKKRKRHLMTVAVLCQLFLLLAAKPASQRPLIKECPAQPIETNASQDWPNDVETGKALYMKACAACHGADGTGNIAMGAPNLTDNIWLYGGSPGAVRQSIAEGRNGKMPAHRDFLGEDKVHLLATYVYSLSN